MQSALQKIFSDPSKTDELKIQVLEKLLLNLNTDEIKLNFLNTQLEFLRGETNVSFILKTFNSSSLLPKLSFMTLY